IDSISVTTDGQGHYSAYVNPGTPTVRVSASCCLEATAFAVPIAIGQVTVRDFVLSPPPDLSPTAVTVDDSGPGGHGNAVIEPDERGLRRVRSLSRGAGRATGLVARLQLAQATDVSILQNFTTVPDAAAGATVVADTAFEVVTGPTLGGGATIPFVLF